jgi:hypothetical protein
MAAERLRTIIVGLALVGGVVVGVAGCAPTTDGGTSGGGTSSGDSSSDDTSTDGSSSSDGDYVVVSGTGIYTIGVDIPLGGFQLSGEPDAQPEGCTWAILDADGAATFENQGQYVFLTDIPEAVTFETSGCPDWEQFE